MRRLLFFLLCVFLTSVVVLFLYFDNRSKNKTEDVVGCGSAGYNINTDICDFLNFKGFFTKEKIADKLFASTTSKEKTVLSFVNPSRLEVVLLDYKDEGDYIRIIVGTDGTNGDRIVFSVKIPIYVISDTSNPVNFYFEELPNRNFSNEAVEVKVKEKKDILQRVITLKGDVIVLSLVDRPISEKSVNMLKNNLSVSRLVTDVNNQIACTQYLSEIVNGNFNKNNECDGLFSLENVGDLSKISLDRLPLITMMFTNYSL